MNYMRFLIFFYCLSQGVAPGAAPSSLPPALPIPPQDQGLPYSRTGQSTALEIIRGYSGLFAGSRYGVVQGHRVRLSDSDAIGGEAIQRNDRLFVPAGFASLLAADDLNAPPVPTDLAPLAPRWVYSPRELLPAGSTMPAGFSPASGVATLASHGVMYCDAAAEAEAHGLKASWHSRGLLLIGKTAFDFTKLTPVQLDAIITVFDTPEKLADPGIATRHIPILAAQGAWQDHARFTPAALALYDAPESDWPSEPESAYSLDNFKAELLGSEVPPPGVYPRLLFSERDLPQFRKGLAENVIGRMSLIEVEELFRKSWWDPTTDDGKAFDKLASGDFSDADFYGAAGRTTAGLPSKMDGQKTGIFNTHVNYLTNCLSTMELYCLLKGNDALGAKAASASVNLLSRLGERGVDEMLAASDSENGVAPGPAHAAATGWRAMGGVVSHWDLPFLLDFGGKWMSASQKDTMRRIIAKATYGRRDTHQAGPVSWRENNHATWHSSNFLAAMAIEGLPGCDPELFPEAIRHTRAFLDYGIDSSGQIFESNGKNGGGINFQVLNMIALARRGHNMWGHPHWRKLLEAQVQNTSPDGNVTVSGGTFSGSRFALQTIMNIKGFYPGNRCADYLLKLNYPDLDLANTDLEKYRQEVGEGKIRALRLVGPTYSGWTRSLLYDTDWQPTTRADLKLPLTFETPEHGILSAYSDAAPEATWLNLQVRSNQYYGAGHHHNDAGMIHFSSGGVNWLHESPFATSYSGRFHNQVCVDGRASFEDGWAAPGKYLGATVHKDAAFAACDLAYSYSWVWMNQAPAGAWDMGDPRINRDWELETHPTAVKYFKGTQHWKMRPWWPSYLFSNWYPVLRSPWNPMRACFRTAGLVRGPHPYALVADDLKKDEQSHEYQWRGMLDQGVVKADVPGLPPGWLALVNPGNKPHPEKIESGGPRPSVIPDKDAPLLLVVPLATGENGNAGEAVVDAGVRDDGPKDNNGNPTYYNCLTLTRSGTEARFRILLLPSKMGEPLPQVAQMDHRMGITFSWGEQKDEILFTEGRDFRTRVSIHRDGSQIVSPLP